MTVASDRNLLWSWYLIEAHAGMMLVAQAEIISRGVEFLRPMTWRRGRVVFAEQNGSIPPISAKNSHVMPVPSPRLPGNYAFVRLPTELGDPDTLAEQAAIVKGLRGVREVFKNAKGMYARVPQWEIDALKKADADEELEAGKAKPRVMAPKFEAGTLVRVVRGEMFEGMVGEFLYAVRGQAAIALPNGIKVPVSECDLARDTSDQARLAG